MRRPILSSELLASRSPFEDGIYVVGPFASRVSFSSQQRRAISLVCDINDDLKASGDQRGINGKNVAIIGAGISGITAGLTVIALGGKAFLYEKSTIEGSGAETIKTGQILPTVRYTTHRDAHPTLNFWPYERIEPFTRLPFLNWHEGTCAEVSTQITQELNQLLRSNQRKNDFQVTNGCTVTGFRRAKNDQAWEIKTRQAAGTSTPWKSRIHDLVVVATGFGKEVFPKHLKSPSYWNSDSTIINELRKQPPTDVKNFVVSGTGDGGLIEALCLLFDEKRAGCIEAETMPLLSNENLKNKMQLIEKQAYKKFIDHALHDSGRIAPNSLDDVSELLWDAYQKLLDDGDVAGHIISAIRSTRSGIPTVTLLGLRKYPMELAASPYHRLLVAICYKEKWLTYIPLHIDEESKRNKKIDPNYVEPDNPVVAKQKRPFMLRGGTAKSGCHLVDLEVKRAVTLEVEKLPDSFCIVRHGYESPLGEFWDREGHQVNRIRRQQALYADQDSLSPLRSKEIAQIFNRPDPSDIPTYFRHYQSRLNSYFNREFGLHVELVENGEDVSFRLKGDVAPTTRRGIPPVLLDRPLEGPQQVTDFGADGFPNDR